MNPILDKVLAKKTKLTQDAYPEDQRGDAWEGAPEATIPPPPEIGISLADIQPQEVRWLWPGRIPYGKLTILDGDPGLGKSALTMDLAARVSGGLGMPDGTPCSPAGVVILNAEDGLDDTILPRLLAAGGDPARVRALPDVPDADSSRPPSLPNDLTYIRSCIAREKALLVIIDPLMAYLDSSVQSHKDQDVRRALHPLALLAQETGAAILVVRHLNKLTGGNPLYRGGGSIGIIGAARSGLLVATDPDNPDRRILASTKCNLAKLPPSLAFDLNLGDNGALRVGWIGPSPHTAASLLARPRDAENPDPEARRQAHTQLEEALEQLASMLANGPRKQSEIMDEAKARGLSESTMHRARRKLEIKSEKINNGDATYYLWHPMKN